MLVPLRTVMESGEIEKATGYKINWRMFGGGGDVIRAMASGDVQVGEVGLGRHHRGGEPGARTSSCSGSSTTSPTPRR
jgi:ABC-type nitrate/sulfonate/bicarbonate transport system substrate-binding protein